MACSRLGSGKTDWYRPILLKKSVLSDCPEAER